MKKVFILICMVLTCAYGVAQDRNNEDEVVKIEWYNQHATKEGELIVKFADHTVLTMTNDAKGALQSTGMQKVDALLQQFPVAQAERLCPNDDPNRELKVSKSYNGPDVVERDLSRLCRFVMEDPMQTYDMIEALNELDEVEFAEPNYMVFALGSSAEPIQPMSPIQPTHPTIPPRDGGSYFNPSAYMAEPMYSLQWGLEDVHLPELWAADTVTTNNTRPVIAIIDTGVDIDHPDLAANIWTNPNETENGYDDDNNGFVDDLHGWDFVNQTADMHDWNSHGTHCAGIAAAVGDNGIGITGANPNAYIMPIAVLQSNGSGDVATIIQGINYAKNNGADVLSMSFGSYSYSLALEQALAQAYQNAVLVAAAGNDGLSMIIPRCTPLALDMFPAAFTFVLGVEATQQYYGACGYRACFSNYDCDGPSFSQYDEEKQYNYELSAPGVGIYSAVPNGGYRNYHGTSMATPLVAGGISALLHAKPYLSQEMLWGDLINTTTEHNPVNFKACYDFDTWNAPSQLQFVTFEMNDTIGGDGDMRPDAGDTICLYPTFRTTWGATSDITFWLTLEEFENPDIVTFLDTEPVDFGRSLSAYAKSKSVNPVRFTINPECVDGRYINMELHANSSNTQAELVFPFTIQVENGVELSGMITDTVILYPNVHYIVTSNLAISNTGLLILKPGTTLKFKDNVGLSNVGRIYAVGTPDSLITFTKTDLGNSWTALNLGSNDTIGYSIIEYHRWILGYAFMHNCIFRNDDSSWGLDSEAYRDLTITTSNLYSLNLRAPWNIAWIIDRYDKKLNNFINNRIGAEANMIDPNVIVNFFNNGNVGEFNLSYSSNTPSEIILGNAFYLGSAREDIVREKIIDFEYPGSNTYGRINLDNLAAQPCSEAHGIVWKVVVNGYDAQDEFEQLPPLGCGKHKFEVYFNKPMDTLVTPMVALGVRPPYTQHAIAEDGYWSADSTIYTAYLTIDGTTVTDGLNRIYVANAQDNEHFEIPYENWRFNVQVSAAGSLSAEFMATPGLGKVDLEWNNNEVDFQDFLGYNMYRYQYDSVLIAGHYDENWNWIEAHNEWMQTDSIQLNTSLIQDTVFTDYNVVPGTRYYYYYKVLRTSLTESDASLTVTTMPLTSVPGDANGSMAVDVADVVSIVSYLTNGNPQPFIFEAADVNSDGTIDILDIVAVINIITNRGSLPDKDPVATAYYSIENGILFVDTPVELGGVQFIFNNLDNLDLLDHLEPLPSLQDFEVVKANTSSGALFMAYSMSGKRLTAGKHALLRVGEGTVNSVALADPEGHNVLAILSGTGITEHETLFLEQPYPNPFNGNLTIPFIIGDERANNVVFTVTNMMGQTISVIELGTRTRGEYQYEWKPASNMASGIYTVSMQVNGHNVQRAKVVYVK